MRIVIKIGTSSLFDIDGEIKSVILKNLITTIVSQFASGHEVVLVVSGAVACGKSNLKKIITEYETSNNYKNNFIYEKYKELGAKEKLTTIEKSLIAGIGQNDLMQMIKEESFKQGLIVEQMLLSGKNDLKNSIAIDNIKECFKKKILVVVNANDTVYKRELMSEERERYSDNDELASNLAKAIEANRLVVITNVEGYLENEKLVREIKVDKGNDYLKKTKQTKSLLGTGGMASKLKNLLEFAKTGGISYIISVDEISYIGDIIEEKRIAGTKICK